VGTAFPATASPFPLNLSDYGARQLWRPREGRAKFQSQLSHPCPGNRRGRFATSEKSLTLANRSAISPFVLGRLGEILVLGGLAFQPEEISISAVSPGCRIPVSYLPLQVSGVKPSPTRKGDGRCLRVKPSSVLLPLVTTRRTRNPAGLVTVGELKCKMLQARNPTPDGGHYGSG